MPDVVFLLFVVGFFAAAAVYVRACAAVVGGAVAPDIDAEVATNASEDAA